MKSKLMIQRLRAVHTKYYSHSRLYAAIRQIASLHFRNNVIQPVCRRLPDARDIAEVKGLKGYPSPLPTLSFGWFDKDFSTDSLRVIVSGDVDQSMIEFANTLCMPDAKNTINDL